jgi:hypothetical protein
VFDTIALVAGAGLLGFALILLIRIFVRVEELHEWMRNERRPK